MAYGTRGRGSGLGYTNGEEGEFEEEHAEESKMLGKEVRELMGMVEKMTEAYMRELVDKMWGLFQEGGEGHQGVAYQGP